MANDRPPDLRELREKILRLETELAGARLALNERLEKGSQDLLPHLTGWYPPSPSDPHSQLGTWVWDLRSSEVTWSPQLFHILGYEPETTQPSTEAFFAAVAPDDREELQRAAERVLQTGREPPTRFHVLRPDGTVREALVDSAAIRTPDGEPILLVGTVLDLTESLATEAFLRRQEHHFRLAQETAGIGSWAFDLVTQSVEWSRELYRIFGVDPETPPSPELYASLIHPDDREIVEATEASFFRGEDTETHEYRIHRASDGELRYMETSGRVLRDDEGRVLGFLGTTLDVTRRKELESRLAQSVKMEALGRLAGGIAHDFNNLLTVIQGYCQLLQRQQDDQPELLHISDAAEAASRLTRQLLQFSRQSVVEPRVLDLNQLIERSSVLLRRIIGEDIRVELDLQPDLGPIRCDPGQIEQILFNLAANSRDAMPQGGRLRLATRDLAGSAPRVELEVSDNGIGMPRDLIQNVFEPFYTTKERGKGTGLGLSTVFGIVTQHQGSIEVESEPGEGTTLRIRLPRASESRSDDAWQSVPPRQSSGPLRILVVEDEPMIARLVDTTLTRAGHQVDRVNSPGAALERVAGGNDQWDLLISDVVMPGMNGPELADALRELRPALRVLFISGYPAGELDLRTRRADGFLGKPFTPDQLLTTAERVARGEERGRGESEDA